MELELTESTRAPRCPYCHERLGAESLWACEKCGTRLHAGCFQEHGRCTTHGCGAVAPASRVEPAPRAPSRLRRAVGYAAFVVSALAFGAVVAWLYVPRFNERKFEGNDAVSRPAALRSIPEAAQPGPRRLSVPGRILHPTMPVRPAFHRGHLVLVDTAIIEPVTEERSLHRGPVLAVDAERILSGESSLLGTKLWLEEEGRLVGEISSPERFHTFAFDPDWPMVIAASENCVERWHMGAKERADRIDLAGVEALAANSKYLLAARGSEVHFVPFDGGDVTSSFDDPVHSVALRETQKGLRGVVVTSGAKVEIHLLEPDGKHERLVELPGRASAVAFVPRAKTLTPTSLVVATFEGDVWYVELDCPSASQPCTLVRRIAKGFFVGAAAVCPDADHVALASLGGGPVFVVTLDFGRVVLEVLPLAFGDQDLDGG